jgi:acetyl-CoA C-acetyltransferase
MKQVVVVDALRTPFGKFGGALKGYSAVELGTLAAKAVLERSGLLPTDVEESLFGSAILAASTSVAARQINFKVGIPAHVPSMTVDRACCSSMTCIGLGLAKIRAGDANVILAGGIESASQTPFMMKNMRWGHRMGDFTVEDPMQMRNPINQQPVARVTGEAALAFGVGRDQQDEWSLASHQNYFKAFEAGVYREEILVMPARDDLNAEMLSIDESPRRQVSIEKLRALPTVYGSATVTAGNAPGLNDGAAVTVLMDAAAAKQRSAPVLAEVVAYAQAAGELDSSVYMPGIAVLMVLKKTGLGLADLKRIEINEAFAAMPLVSTAKMAEGDSQLVARLRSITNVNGGSVAMGHPTGASGARVVMALARELRRVGGGYGVAAICGGYGQADAILLKV